jgi:hypothetical protein
MSRTRKHPTPKTMHNMMFSAKDEVIPNSESLHKSQRRGGMLIEGNIT